MEKSIAKLGGSLRVAHLDLWKKREQTMWNITINEAEVKYQPLRNQKIAEENYRVK